jgi:uncharacterized membrane protein YhaH (DUF805 family)
VGGGCFGLSGRARREGVWCRICFFLILILVLILILILILLVSECDGVPTYDTCIYV